MNLLEILVLVFKTLEKSGDSKIEGIEAESFKIWKFTHEVHT